MSSQLRVLHSKITLVGLHYQPQTSRPLLELGSSMRNALMVGHGSHVIQLIGVADEYYKSRGAAY